MHFPPRKKKEQKNKRVRSRRNCNKHEEWMNERTKEKDQRKEETNL